MKKYIALILAILFVAGCVKTIPTEKVTGVSISQPSLSLTVGEQASLSATVTPSDADNQEVVWTSSSPAVATVTDGVVKGISEGKAVITVKTVDGGFTAECSVTVNDKSKVIPVTGIALDKTSLELTVDESVTLTASVSPSDATNKKVSWSTSDGNVVSVKEGKVTALKAGKATVSVVTDDGGFKAECSITVLDKKHPVTGVSLDQTSLNLTVEESATLTATVSPSDATNKNVSWTTSDANVASVVEGKVNALKAGTAIITVITEDGGFEAECSITVVDKKIPVTGVSLDRTDISITIGSQVSLTANVQPEDATTQTVSWSSDDESVVRVDDGIVSGVGVGSAVVTVKTDDGGFTASCSVTVNPSESVIKYTTSDGQPVYVNLPQAIGTLVSNLYVGDIGFLTFEEGILSIGERAFQAADNLTGIEIPASVMSIGNGAFMNCSSLQSIVLPPSVTSVGESAFTGCTSLKSFSGAFASDDGRCLIDGGKLIAFAPAGLTEFSVPSEVTSIGKAVFSGCYSLSSLTLPDGLTEIGPAAFRGCSSLTSIEIPAGVERIPTSAFEGCEILSEVNIPSSVKVIEQYAFMSCRSLQRIILPEGVETLGDDCFRMSTSLTIVDLPSTVNRVGNNCFYDCLSLYSVTVRASVPPQLGSSAFRNVPVYCNFNVPADSMEAYQASSWNNYNGRLFPIEE